MKPLDFKWYIIIGLLIVVVLMILLQPSPQEPNTDAFKNEIARRNEQIKSKTAQIERLVIEVERRDSIHTSERKSFQVALKSKSNRIDKLLASPKIIHVRDSVPEVDSLITDLQDKIEFQSEYIASLDSSYNDLRGDFEEVKD